ncbi:MAG: hypothetical protein M3Q66_10670 [Chloroflexota bacterium]|nr:hypothetical protein [Chloroflexota bacterium]
MRIAYSLAAKQEAVALARVMGIEAAAQQLNIDRRTVRGWSEKAGVVPELKGTASAWQRAFDLAQAKVERFLASGKVSPVQAATIMGIADRNMRLGHDPLDALEDPDAERIPAWQLRIDAYVAAVPEAEREWTADCLNRELGLEIRAELNRRAEIAALADAEDVRPPEPAIAIRRASQAAPWVEPEREPEPASIEPQPAEDIPVEVIEAFLVRFDALRPEFRARFDARLAVRRSTGFDLDDAATDLLIQAEKVLAELEVSA